MGIFSKTFKELVFSGSHATRTHLVRCGWPVEHVCAEAHRIRFLRTPSLVEDLGCYLDEGVPAVVGGPGCKILVVSVGIVA